MAKRAPNPNTKYGRKRQQEEYYSRRAELSPSERDSQDSSFAIWGTIIVIIIAGIIFMIGGQDAILKWVSR